VDQAVVQGFEEQPAHGACPDDADLQPVVLHGAVLRGRAVLLGLEDLHGVGHEEQRLAGDGVADELVLHQEVLEQALAEVCGERQLVEALRDHVDGDLLVLHLLAHPSAPCPASRRAARVALSRGPSP